jgi:hypothetical protein
MAIMNSTAAQITGVGPYQAPSMNYHTPVYGGGVYTGMQPLSLFNMGGDGEIA